MTGKACAFYESFVPGFASKAYPIPAVCRNGDSRACDHDRQFTASCAEPRSRPSESSAVIVSASKLPQARSATPRLELAVVANSRREEGPKLSVNPWVEVFSLRVQSRFEVARHVICQHLKRAVRNAVIGLGDDVAALIFGTSQLADIGVSTMPTSRPTTCRLCPQLQPQAVGGGPDSRLGRRIAGGRGSPRRTEC